jgi:hypothetical protein
MTSFLKRKKEAKKEKRVKKWITLRVTHFLTRQTNKNNNIFIFIKNCQLTLGRVTVLTAATALWLNFSQKKAARKTVNKAILSEISRLLQVLCSHLGLWHNCMKNKNIDLPVIPFNTDVYDNFLKNIGDLDDKYASDAVGFYGYVKFLNLLQKSRTEYIQIEKEKEFSKTYEAALYNLVKNYRDKFDDSFIYYDIKGPIMTHCNTNIDNQADRLKLSGRVL